MQILFIDESGTPPPIHNTQSSPFFVLGGVIISEELWHKVKADLTSIKKKLNIEGEIKWRYFVPQKQNNSLSHLTFNEKEKLRDDLFSVLNKYKSIRTICIITNATKAYELPYIQTQDDLYWYSYKQITERFQYYLQDISRISGHHTNGIIVCDHRGPNDDKRLQELHAKLLSTDHGAYSNYNNLIEGVFMAPSHLSIGIQFADLVAGAALRYFKSGDERFFKQIKDTLRKSEAGIAEGYGIVHFPKYNM